MENMLTQRGVGWIPQYRVAVSWKNVALTASTVSLGSVNSKENDVQQVKAVWELASSVIKWGSLLIGGVCLLATSAAIGQFPQDINVGEGVALYFLSAGFVLAYAFYWLAVTSIGLCLLRWPMELHPAPDYRSCSCSNLLVRKSISARTEGSSPRRDGNTACTMPGFGAQSGTRLISNP